MPELPEVETVVNNLRPSLEKLIITAVDLRHTDLRMPVDPSIVQKLTGQHIVSTYRRAKWPALVLEKGYLWLHLGMTGQILISDSTMPNDPHVHLVLTLSNHKYLIFKDPRKFGTIAYTTDQNPPTKNLGPEPLDTAFTAEILKQNLSKTKKAIKLSLMDNKIVSGIGNIYASEILFESNINPNTSSNKINLDACKILVKNIKTILNAAIQHGGSTLRDYRHPDGSTGSAQNIHKIYNKTGQPCAKCKTPISEMAHGGRSTFWCVNCQK